MASIGIDLGTTFCCVAGINNKGDVFIIRNEHGNCTTPSFIAICNNEIIVGEDAAQYQTINPKDVIYDVKRFIGKCFEDIDAKCIATWPFIVERDENNSPLVTMGSKFYNPEELSAILLRAIKKMAEKHLNTSVDSAVITVPAHFGDKRRQATITAAQIAGLNVLRIINEPTAAALAYELDNKSDQTVLVYDLGGGTFDVAILTIKDKMISVKSTQGDSSLGGRDFDQILVTYCIAEMKKKWIDFCETQDIQNILKVECEKCKRALSVKSTHTLIIPRLHNQENFELLLTRSVLEGLFTPLISKTIKLVQKTLDEANLNKSEISEVLLVGGSTRIPLIAQSLEQFFEKKINHTLHPDEAVAIGAGRHARHLRESKSDVLLSDVTPTSLGVAEGKEDRMSVIIEKNDPIPITKKQIYTTMFDNQTLVNIAVYEGENAFVKDNSFLNSFELVVAPKPKGKAKVKVSFKINEDGVLEVSAQDEETKLKSQVVIKKFYSSKKIQESKRKLNFE